MPRDIRRYSNKEHPGNARSALADGRVSVNDGVIEFDDLYVVYVAIRGSSPLLAETGQSFYLWRGDFVLPSRLF